VNIRSRGVVAGVVTFAAGGLIAATTATAAPSVSSGTKIALRHAPSGKVLDGTGRKYVYVHVSPTKSDVGCSGLCPSIWPAVKTSGTPRAGNGVKASKLGQTASHQVTYNGHPLFYYSPAPQSPSIDGAKSFGGKWRLMNAKGNFK